MDIEARYELLEKIGTGSYATVYRARDTELGREVAVKQIHQQYLDDPNQLERYWQEAQLLASLQHPNIVTIFDVFRERGWLILELMQSNLGERMANRQMDLRGLRTTIAHALRALKYLHARGIVHGDIKPSNLMIDHRRRIKIGDFGLARRVSDEEGSLLKGTTKYMAPEVVSDEFGEVGPASDLYSLGFSAYELMCGPNFEDLFPGLSAFGRNKQVAWMMWHAASDRRLPEIHRVLEGVPDDLATVIQKLCEKDQSRRYHSTEDAFEDLNIDVKVVKPEETAGDETPEQPAEDAQRKRRMLAIGAFAASLLLSLLILFFPSGGGPGDTDNATVKYGIVAEIYLDENKIKIEGLEDGIPEEIEVGKRPKIFLRNTERNILLRELRPGDRLRFKTISEGADQLVRDITVSRPVSSRGRVKTINLNAKRIVIAVDEGATREDLPLYVPERAELRLNGERKKLRDLRAEDQVTVSHLEEIGGNGGRVVDKLDARRRMTSAGFVSAVDLKQGRLRVQFGLGSTSSSFELPIAEECRIRVQGQDSKQIGLNDLQKNDRVKLFYDIEIREIVVSPSKLQVSGVLQHAPASTGQVVVSTSEGQRLTFAVERSGDVMLNREPAGLTDLRKNDAVDVTYDKSPKGLKASTLDARRPVRKDRWAVVIGTGAYDDKSVSPLAYAHCNAKLFVETLRKRYAFSADRLRMLLDPTRKTMQEEMSAVLEAARSPTQVLVYISGHAYVADNDRVYLAGRDFKLDQMSETGVPLDWLAQELEACESDDKILFLDCSHAETGEDSGRQPSTAAMLRKLKTPLKSTAAIASCSKTERGLNWTEKGHGLFAHFLADGFSGRADRDHDLHITAGEIFNHLKTGMSSVSVDGNASQTPVLFSPRPGAR